MKRNVTYVCVVLAVLCTDAQAENNRLLDKHYRVEAIKAEVVYRLIKHITWESKNDEALNLCVEGNKMTYERMIELTRRGGWQSPVRIVINPQMDKVKSCQVLYISGDRFSRFALFKNILQDHSTLTVSDRTRFIDMGGMVGLVEIQGRITIELNVQMMNAHQLIPSPALIEIANRVIN